MKMKKTFKFFMSAAIMAAGFTGCSSEEVNGPDIDKGTETYSSLTIKDATSTPATYGTTSTDDPANTETLGNANRLKAYIFNGDISAAPATLGFIAPATDISFTGPTGVNNVYTSNKFKLLSGDKFIYVLADQKGLTPAITQQTSRSAYEIQEVAAGFTNSTEDVATTSAPAGTVKRVVPLPANIATDNSFVLGTLWGKTTTIAGGGTEDTPVPVSGLTIGRLASKIKLESVTPGASTPLGGTFEHASAIYRICSVPDAMYLVGQWDGTNEPGTNAIAALVKSLHHDESFGTVGNQNTKFKNYQWTGAKVANTSNFYYTVENTTALQGGDQYYGNSTYIQMRIKYIPASNQIFKADGSQGSSSDLTNNGTFWLFYVNGAPRIFAAEPLQSIPGISTTGTKYEEGYMYYSFPIADNSETDPVKKHTVLRNHSYIVKVTEIKNFGSGSDAEVTPETPLSNETWVTLEVSVLPWSKIEQNVPL